MYLIDHSKAFEKLDLGDVKEVLALSLSYEEAADLVEVLENGLTCTEADNTHVQEVARELISLIDVLELPLVV